jgi:hypothetical protein
MFSNFIQLEFYDKNLCCISKSTMKHQQANGLINWIFPNLVMLIESTCLLIGSLTSVSRIVV